MKGKKTGGRQKGVQNKVTSDVRQKFQEFIEGNFNTFSKDWKRIKDPKDKVKLYIDAAKFVIPALQSIDLDANVSNDKSIEEKLLELEKRQTQ